MNARFVAAVLCVAGISVVGAQQATTPQAEGSKEPYKAKRTPDGKPDISGIFTFRTITPLQRPTGLGEKDKLDAQEAAEFEAAENTRLNRDTYDPERGQPSAGYPPRSQGGVLSYNDFWYERGNKLTEDMRTSLIYDPADGRIPFIPDVRAKAAAFAQKVSMGFADTYTDRTLADRCILGFNSGPPMVSGAYNNNVQILQAPGFVAIVNEMVHNARIIPTDGRPHGQLRQWAGDSRGRWEGDTLVVETLNFRQETSLAGSSANTKLIERFTRVDDDTVMYDFTVEDSSTYTRPWSARMPLQRSDEVLFEYACHEGNYAMAGILGGARARDKEAAKGR